MLVNDNIINEISTDYADMMSHMFPEMKEKHNYNNLKARASNIIHVILRKYHIVSNDKLYEVYKNSCGDTLEKLFGEPLIDYLAQAEAEELRTGEKPKWVRTYKPKNNNID